MIMMTWTTEYLFCKFISVVVVDFQIHSDEGLMILRLN